MASENETVAEIAANYRAIWQGCESVSLSEYEGKDVLELVERFEAAYKREVAELREFSNDMRTWFRLYYSCGSNPKSKWWRSCASCRRKSCPIHKWRKTLEGATK